MGGLEIERMLRRIDENVDANSRIMRDEVLEYIGAHSAEVIAQLRSRGEASIPTSLGMVTIPISELGAVAA
jgi:hypothetical protein